MSVGLDASGSPLQVAIVPQRLERLRHAGIAGRGTQDFARLENAGLHRVPNGLCWDLGGCSLLEWWGGGDCVVRDMLFMGPLRQMRRVAGVEVAVAKGCQCEREGVRMSRGQTVPRITPRLSPTSSCLPASVNFAGPTRRAAQVSFSAHRPQTRATTPRNSKTGVYQG